MSEYVRACAVSDLKDGGAIQVTLGGDEIALVKSEGEVYAIRVEVNDTDDLSLKNCATPDQGQDNPYRCPYCQVAASLGAMLGVSVLLITMPAAQLAVEPLANLAAAADSPASYVQRNRGPPLR